jgi:hypothetical protein
LIIKVHGSESGYTNSDFSESFFSQFTLIYGLLRVFLRPMYVALRTATQNTAMQYFSLLLRIQERSSSRLDQRTGFSVSAFLLLIFSAST